MPRSFKSHAIGDAFDSSRRWAHSARPNKSSRDDSSFPIDADYPRAIVTDRPDDPGHVCPMTVKVHRVSCVVQSVDTVHVIDVPVFVIVDSISRDLPGIYPHVLLYIGMKVIHPGIDDQYKAIPSTY